MFVDQLGDFWVGEALALHHVAPVTGGVADREEDRLVLTPGLLERLLAPRVPVDRIVRVLEQVRRFLAGQAVGRLFAFGCGAAGRGAEQRRA
jgi:hypothetical protein